MLHSKQRLLELNAKLAENLTSKGVTATADETTTALVNKVAEISTGGGESSVLNSLIDGSLTEIIIPKSITSIGRHAFYSQTNLQKVIFSEGLLKINVYAFSNTGLVEVETPKSLKSLDGDNIFADCTKMLSAVINGDNLAISAYCFRRNRSLKTLIINSGVISIKSCAFADCDSLQTVSLPNTLTGDLATDAFSGDKNLEFVTLEEGFNANNLNLSVSTKYSHDTILSWLNALADRTGLTAYTLTIGTTNLAKLTEDEKKIATDKNWNLA